MIDLSGVSMPFNVSDLLQSVIGFITTIGPFVLLGIVVAFSPQIIDFLKDAILVEKNRRRINDRYFRDDPVSFRDSFKYNAKSWWNNRHYDD